VKRHLSTGALAAVACTIVLVVSGCGSSGGSGGGGGSAAPQPSDTAPTSVATATSGKLTITPPQGWKRLDDEQQKDSYHLVISGTCGYDGAAQLSGCHSVHVLGAAYVAPNPNSDNALPIQPYQPDEPHAGQYLQDNGYECPADKNLRAATTKQGAKLVKQGTAQVGGKTAQYREWEIPCWTKDPESGQPKAKSATVYTERDWYVTDEKVLIVDEWKTAALQGLLTKATWG
jgi:hypothetical protein